ncbi:MAG: hypothetical protein ABGW69_01030 [Nanoarchaeota archaeon]
MLYERIGVAILAIVVLVTSMFFTYNFFIKENPLLVKDKVKLRFVDNCKYYLDNYPNLRALINEKEVNGKTIYYIKPDKIKELAFSILDYDKQVIDNKQDLSLLGMTMSKQSVSIGLKQKTRSVLERQCNLLISDNGENIQTINNIYLVIDYNKISDLLLKSKNLLKCKDLATSNNFKSDLFNETLKVLKGNRIYAVISSQSKSIVLSGNDNIILVPPVFYLAYSYGLDIKYNLNDLNSIKGFLILKKTSIGWIVNDLTPDYNFNDFFSYFDRILFLPNYLQYLGTNLTLENLEKLVKEFGYKNYIYAELYPFQGKDGSKCILYNDLLKDDLSNFEVDFGVFTNEDDITLLNGVADKIIFYTFKNNLLTTSSIRYVKNLNLNPLYKGEDNPFLSVFFSAEASDFLYRLKKYLKKQNYLLLNLNYSNKIAILSILSGSYNNNEDFNYYKKFFKTNGFTDIDNLLNSVKQEKNLKINLVNPNGYIPSYYDSSTKTWYIYNIKIPLDFIKEHLNNDLFIKKDGKNINIKDIIKNADNSQIIKVDDLGITPEKIIINLYTPY